MNDDGDVTRSRPAPNRLPRELLDYFQAILHRVAHVAGVSPGEIIRHARKPEVCIARDQVIRELHETVQQGVPMGIHKPGGSVFRINGGPVVGPYDRERRYDRQALSTVMIGRLMHRDHSTIVLALRRMEKVRP